MNALTLEQLLKKARTAKSMVMVCALALDDPDATFDGPEFALAMREVENQLAGLTEAMENAIERGTMEMVG